jgi:hypothetical protein
MGSSSGDENYNQGRVEPGVNGVPGLPVDILQPAQKPPGFVSFLPNQPGQVATGLTGQNFSDIDAAQRDAALSAAGNNPLDPAADAAKRDALAKAMAAAASAQPQGRMMPTIAEETAMSPIGGGRLGRGTGGGGALEARARLDKLYRDQQRSGIKPNPTPGLMVI